MSGSTPVVDLMSDSTKEADASQSAYATKKVHGLSRLHMHHCTPLVSHVSLFTHLTHLLLHDATPMSLATNRSPLSVHCWQTSSACWRHSPSSFATWQPRNMPGNARNMPVNARNMPGNAR